MKAMKKTNIIQNDDTLKSKQSDTKLRIIDVATMLFADRGFEGASVREIAKIAEVNLAAINYHFSNKQNLYHAVLRNGLLRLNLEIKDLANEKNRTTTEFAIALYRMMIGNGARLINNFKVLLNDYSFPQDLIIKDQAGPPGSEQLLKTLELELGKQLSSENGQWAVRVLFTFVSHTALMASTHYGQQQCGLIFNQKLVEENIKRLVSVLLEDLKNRTH
jgi:AcrR family transcriptional regulator